MLSTWSTITGCEKWRYFGECLMGTLFWPEGISRGGGGVYFEAPRGRNCIRPPPHYTPPAPRKGFFEGFRGLGVYKKLALYMLEFLKILLVLSGGKKSHAAAALRKNANQEASWNLPLHLRRCCVLCLLHSRPRREKQQHCHCPRPVATEGQILRNRRTPEEGRRPILAVGAHMS